MEFLLIAGLLVLGATGLVAFQASRLSAKQKKRLLRKSLSGFFTWCEERGLLSITPAFDHDYHAKFPKLQLLEENWQTIHDECVELLKLDNKLTDISKLGGSYTESGIHVIQWKTFMFKSGTFIEPNCERAPKTAALLREIPGMYTAFFSILAPKQYITPHWGYYKGFVRYHLGVIIPDDNAGRECWLRVNADREHNALRTHDGVEKGETYYWRNGEGIVFDDNYLHDAANESDEIRVVLWLDMRRPMPFYLQALNRLVLFIAHRDKSIRKIQRATVIES